MSTTNLLKTGMYLCGLVALSAMGRRGDDEPGHILGPVIPVLLIPFASLLLQRAIMRSPLLRIVRWY